MYKTKENTKKLMLFFLKYLNPFNRITGNMAALAREDASLGGAENSHSHASDAFLRGAVEDDAAARLGVDMSGDFGVSGEDLGEVDGRGTYGHFDLKSGPGGRLEIGLDAATLEEQLHGVAARVVGQGVGDRRGRNFPRIRRGNVNFSVLWVFGVLDLVDGQGDGGIAEPVTRFDVITDDSGPFAKMEGLERWLVGSFGDLRFALIYLHLLTTTKKLRTADPPRFRPRGLQYSS